ncbi:hypothetical protein PMAYCL1PPCAC_21948, partial [Pristionchus mayeri]
SEHYDILSCDHVKWEERVALIMRFDTRFQSSALRVNAFRTREMQSMLLYAAYLCTCLEDRAWSFAISLCMQFLGGIQLVSIEQLIEGLAQIGFSGSVGRLVDLRSERKWGMIICVIGNNFSMISSCLLFLLCLPMERSNWIYTLSLLTALVLCATWRVFMIAERNVLARDWALVLVSVRGSMNRRLARTNAILTSLDQLANVLSPLLLGAVLSFASLQSTCIILAGYSAASLLLKGTLLITLYERNEDLRTKKERSRTLLEATVDSSKESDRKSSRISNLFIVLSTYYSQTVFSAAFGLALLYMTVLGFNGLDIAYGESVGLPENVMAFFRSFGSVAGIAGALMYAVFERQFGVRRTGVIGMMIQASLLSLCVVSIWLSGSPWNPTAYFSTMTWSSWWHALLGNFVSSPQPTSSEASTPPPAPHASAHIDWSTMASSDGTSIVSIFTFLIAIAASRFGLWMADLAITHIMQVATPESQRNTVFGVQNAICQTFSVLKDVLVIVLPSPSTFGICIIISYGFKLAGCCSYLFYIAKSSAQARKLTKDQELRKFSTEEAKNL